MEIKEFILKELERHPKDIVNLTMRKFGISRPGIHKHLNYLIQEGRVYAEGRTRNKRYSLTSLYKVHFKVPVSQTLTEEQLWNNRIKAAAIHLPNNILEICQYGFTEMVNNVIDHSQARTLEVRCNFSGPHITLSIKDDGIGVFQKVKRALKLETEREAILHLSKGKLTTDPQHHSGEGIFFTSRIFDRFSLTSNHLTYVRIQEDDWLVDEHTPIQGTQVTMEMNHSSKSLKNLFDKYTGTDFSVSKTRVVVALGLITGEMYISRSQAKRILFGLEKFKHIVLDFKRVNTVGQGFVDEVCRVFQNQHPEIKIEPVNANENVDFMIKRSLT